MKLVSYRGDGEAPRTGVVLEAGILDVSEWIAAQAVSGSTQEHCLRSGHPAASGGMLRLLQGGADVMRSLHVHVEQCQAQAATRYQTLESVRLYPPVPRPGKVVAVGRNYADHAKETGVAPFEKPRIIGKLASCLSSPGAIVACPDGVKKLDFEAELAVVIGDYGYCVPESRALEWVAGYSVLNDLSAREFQFDISPPQTTFAKSMDGFCPMGPWLLTSDEIGDPQSLMVSSWVNGVLKQQAGTRDMLFPVATLVAYISRFMTLEPGDVLATGTPAGSGAFRTPPEYLQAGDRVRLEVSGVGVLEHSIA
ncbi:fumarylacetoacetate hydrolase family protein [Paralcaligenes sp. KSB-10]|uniref:fumarylacetoacetate hydrolase family protein n=1 Tax=Paralcaligenes sp. KSB-10 TaxID=2901142 RepID=UPI001E49740A|nr:fumarylacetoacetate hydrolase family protein [Paralcaligenes sp. KSB-10]UHL64016.1 fumarylacetoacetate hydrolase family protein [Paralcaligenes sp. KSB-10]